MLVCCVIITFAGIPSIDVKHFSITENPPEHISIKVDWSANAYADQRAMHACGNEKPTADQLKHAVTHCNIWQLGVLIFGLLAIVATVIAGTVASGGAFLSFTAGQWVLIAGAYGGLALLYGYLGSVCDANKGMC